MLIYLAGPVDRERDDEDWREHAKRRLSERGHWTFDPRAAFRGENPAYPPAVMQIDLEAVRLADAVLVHFTGAETVGTLIEIGYAYALGKPVVASGRCPKLVADLVPTFGSLMEAVDEVERQAVEARRAGDR